MAALTLITTVGSTTATTYADAAYATDYFQTRLGGEQWQPTDTAQTTALLLTAMRVLEDLRFIGTRAAADQRLQWPRVANNPSERSNRKERVTGYESIDISSGGLFDRRNRFWPATAIPYPIKDAQCEIAFALLQDASVLDLTDTPGGVAFAAGSVRIQERARALLQIQTAAAHMLSAFVESGTRLRESL